MISQEILRDIIIRQRVGVEREGDFIERMIRDKVPDACGGFIGEAAG
jgi:hypothetical protein